MAQCLPIFDYCAYLARFLVVFCQPPVYSIPRLFDSTVYVNTRICDEGNIKKNTPYNEHDNTSGEFHFLKWRTTKTVGNLSYWVMSTARHRVNVIN